MAEENGVREETRCQAKCLLCVWMEFQFAILRRRNPKQTGHQEEPNKLPFVSKQSEIPTSQPCAGKELSFVIPVQVHSVMSIYIHMCIYILSRLILTVAIASFEFLNL